MDPHPNEVVYRFRGNCGVLVWSCDRSLVAIYGIRREIQSFLRLEINLLRPVEDLKWPVIVKKDEG